MLQKQRVEISRATAPFTVQVPVRRRRPAPAVAAAARAAEGAAARRCRSRCAQPQATPAPPRARGRSRASSRPAATSSAWTSRTRASPTRCSTISTGRRTIRRRTRTTTPAGRSRKASPCRPCACSIRRCSTRRWSSSPATSRAAGGVDGHRQPSSRSITTPTTRSSRCATSCKAADIQVAEEPFEAGGAEVRARLVHHPRRRAGRSRRGGEGARPAGVTRCRRRRR